MTRNVNTPVRRFSIYLGDAEPFDADARLSMMDEITGSVCGLTWFTQYDDHAESGICRDMPYVIIDREYPYTMDEFLGLAIAKEEGKKEDPRDTQ